MYISITPDGKIKQITNGLKEIQDADLVVSLNLVDGGLDVALLKNRFGPILSKYYVLLPINLKAPHGG